jgi:hypothetical protein
LEELSSDDEVATDEEYLLLPDDPEPVEDSREVALPHISELRYYGKIVLSGRPNDQGIRNNPVFEYALIKSHKQGVQPLNTIHTPRRYFHAWVVKYFCCSPRCR